MHYTRDEATKIIRRRSSADENVQFTSHAEERMCLRDIDLLSILECLRRGTVTRDPEFDETHQQWKYRVEEGKGRMRLTAIVAINDDERSILVISPF